MMDHKSIWHASSDRRAFSFSHLPADMPSKVDVCIVGAGIAGLTTAYHLVRAGLSVAVLESQFVGYGDTGSTSAHLSCILGRRYHELEKMHGAIGVGMIINAHQNAINTIEAITVNEDIACDFRRVNGYLFRASDDQDTDLERECELLRSSGIDASFGTKVHCVEDDADTFMVTNQAAFHPLKYLYGLADTVVRHGGSIVEQCLVTSIDAEGDIVRVSTQDDKTITCTNVVICTNSPIHTRFAYHTKQAPYRTYVIGFRVAKGSVPDELVWDTASPYHYIRIVPFESHDIVIVGGADHKVGQEQHPDNHYDHLKGWAKRQGFQFEDIDYSWSGQVLETVDGIGYAGRSVGETNIHVITGDCGNGLTHGTLGAAIVANEILSPKSDFVTIFFPGRSALNGIADWVRENLNTLAQYADWFTPGDVQSINDIQPESGAIMRQGMKKVAMYRDADKQLHILHAECPHLGCIVRWNSSERTWDCPCHGSRFTATGEVIQGPASENLQHYAKS